MHSYSSFEPQFLQLMLIVSTTFVQVDIANVPLCGIECAPCGRLGQGAFARLQFRSLFQECWRQTQRLIHKAHEQASLRRLFRGKTGRRGSGARAHQSGKCLPLHSHTRSGTTWLFQHMGEVSLSGPARRAIAVLRRPHSWLSELHLELSLSPELPRSIPMCRLQSAPKMAAELADGTRFIGDLAEIFPRSRVPALRHCDRDPLIVNIQANMTTFECWSIKRWNLDLRADRADRQKAFGKGQRQVYAPRAGALAAAEQPGQNLAGIDERRVDAQLAKGLVKPGETGVEFAVDWCWPSRSRPPLASKII